MRRLVLALTVVLLASVASAAPAPPPTVPADPEGVVVGDLVVRAPGGGPAWWRVISPTTTVWVLGVPSALPKGLKWTDVVLQRHLSRASRVILPPTVKFGVFDMFPALGLANKLKTKGPIEATLPPDLARRFVAAAATVRQPPSHYDRLKPALAGLLMVSDFRKQAGLDDNQPLAAIRSAAGRRGVKSAPAAAYPGMPMMKGLVGELSDAVNVACLSDALQELESGSGRVKAAAQAWAVGDVPGALTAERGYERCLAALPDGAALVRRQELDQAAAISQALKVPGEAIAVVELRPLLAQGGVLDRLRAAGYAVRAPGN